MKSGSLSFLEPYGPVHALTGIALSFYLLPFTVNDGQNSQEKHL
jgi:hypothetical protein